MQIGTKIWAIDPCEFKGKNLLTENKSYTVIDYDESSFVIVNDLEYESLFFNIVFDTYFSLTPPKEKELKMELNYLKALLPVVKEDLQTSYDIVGHESTAINRFVSKVEELINSQS